MKIFLPPKRTPAFDRRGARAKGSKAAPLLVLPCSQSPKNIPTIHQKQLRHRVTPLLAQRFTLSGNSYFWRTGHIRKQFEIIHPNFAA
jgi:hypothetical protein